MVGTLRKIAAVSLIAMLAAGCASQNAMTLLPDDVKLSIAADQARAEAADAVSTSDAAPMTNAEMLEKARKLAAATRTEAGLPAEDTAAAPAPEAAAAETDENPEALFARALEMARSQSQDGVIGEDAAVEPDTDLAYAAEPVATPVAEPAATVAESFEEDPVAFADQIRTAAFATGADERKRDEDAFVFTTDLEKGGLTPQIVTQLRLRFIVGRFGRRIVVGRLEGQIHEALQEACRRGEEVAAIAGPDAGMTYDPALPAGSVRVEYEPRT